MYFCPSDCSEGLWLVPPDSFPTPFHPSLCSGRLISDLPDREGEYSIGDSEKAESKIYCSHSRFLTYLVATSLYLQFLRKLPALWGSPLCLWVLATTPSFHPFRPRIVIAPAMSSPRLLSWSVDSFSHPDLWKCRFVGLPRRVSGKESTCQCRRCWRYSFHPWVGKIPWRRKRQPTPVLLPMDRGTWWTIVYEVTESDTIEWLSRHAAPLLGWA